jgi:hypothetical protein
MERFRKPFWLRAIAGRTSARDLRRARIEFLFDTMDPISISLRHRPAYQ